MHELGFKNTTAFINPFVINSLPCTVFVGEDGVTLSDDRGLNFGVALLSPLVAGTGVHMRLENRKFKLYLASEYQNQLTEIATKREQEKRETIERLEQLRKSNLMFNQALNLPFQWKIDIKVRMSGLSENSWGDGQSRSTVYHIRVMEQFTEGRLKRNIGDFLCGKDHSKHQGYTDGYDLDHDKVSCAACLKIAARFNHKGDK
ncbi:hypothetical protein [Photobacterium leiognathi]|uniref:hypothetical protein n=1 Tax=Photobacterium leiognathi TaxID=553611 RepID=UPI002980EE88|nr:hypothetical protein [Photobacterium leiognathi]